MTGVFFFNDTATTEIYTLSLHDALPISVVEAHGDLGGAVPVDVREHLQGIAREVERLALERPERGVASTREGEQDAIADRSEEHTSELQSRQYLVCRLLLEKKKQQ